MSELATVFLLLPPTPFPFFRDDRHFEWVKTRYRYYGLMMWFPELFNRFDEYNRIHPGREASVCQVTEFVITRGSHSHADLCDDSIEGAVFMDSFITVAAAIPSNILAVLGMDHVGRKFFLGRFSLVSVLFWIPPSTFFSFNRVFFCLFYYYYYYSFQFSARFPLGFVPSECTLYTTLATIL